MRFITTFLLVLLLFTVTLSANQVKHILLLQSYHQGHPWEDDVTAGVRKVFLESEQMIWLSIEYLDTKRIKSESHFQNMIKVYEEKFKNEHFDLIIANDDNAFSFALDNRKQLFDSAPVVFCGVSYNPEERSKKELDVTGIVQAIEFQQTMNLALKLHPHADQLVVINDRTVSGLKRRAQIKQALMALDRPVKQYFYDNLTVDELLERLKAMPPTSLLFLHLFNKDKDGRQITRDELMKLIRTVYAGPIYAARKSFLTHGIVGGFLSDGEKHGEAVAKIALSIVSGTSIDSIPVVVSGFDKPAFDYRELLSQRILLSSIPEKSEIVNVPFSFYETYKMQIYMISALVILILISIVMLVLYVITRYRAEKELKHTHKMKAIGELTGGISHDFKNILGGIIGASQLLESSKESLSEENQGYVDIILQSAYRGKNLIDKLLLFGRKESGGFKQIDIHQLMSETESIFKSTVDRRIRFSIEKHAGSCMVSGDGTALQTVFMNLGINASHAMPHGGKITVTTSNVRLDTAKCEAYASDIKPGDYIEIEIRDTGAGIAKEDLKKIFDPFFTTKKAGKGTGFGLATAYSILEKHHGAIRVESEVGKGTVFYILLPCIS